MCSAANSFISLRNNSRATFLRSAGNGATREFEIPIITSRSTIYLIIFNDTHLRGRQAILHFLSDIEPRSSISIKKVSSREICTCREGR